MAQRVRELTAQRSAAHTAIDDLIRRGNAELTQIDADYQQALTLAQYQSDPNAAIARALEVRNMQAVAMRQQYDTNIAMLRAQDDAARSEMGQINARAKQMLDSIPSE